MKQIYRRTPMPKCGFNNVALENELKLWLYQVRFFFQDINNEILGETKLIFRPS